MGLRRQQGLRMFRVSEVLGVGQMRSRRAHKYLGFSVSGVSPKPCMS